MESSFAIRSQKPYGCCGAAAVLAKRRFIAVRGMLPSSSRRRLFTPSLFTNHPSSPDWRTCRQTPTDLNCSVGGLLPYDSSPAWLSASFQESCPSVATYGTSPQIWRSSYAVCCYGLISVVRYSVVVSSTWSGASSGHRTLQ